MSQRDYKALFQFSDSWFTLGVVTEERLCQYGAAYESSEDKNPEHYRYGAFRSYLSQHRPLAPSTAEALYELGQSDLDSMMGEAMMADIVSLPECPAGVIEKASNSGRKLLVTLGQRRRTV